MSSERQELNSEASKMSSQGSELNSKASEVSSDGQNCGLRLQNSIHWRFATRMEGQS